MKRKNISTYRFHKINMYSGIWKNTLLLLILLTLFLSNAHASENDVSNQNESNIYETAVSRDWEQWVKNKMEMRDMQSIKSISIHEIENKTIFYEVSSTQIIPISAGRIKINITSRVDPTTGEIITVKREISKNDELVVEKPDELIVIHNNKMVTLKNINDKETKREKMLVETVKPLVEIKKIEKPVLSKNERFVLQVKKNHSIPYKQKWIESDNYDFIIVESNDLTKYLNNDYVVKISDGSNLKEFINYSKEILKAEAKEKIRQLKLKKTIQDVTTIQELNIYLEEDKWTPQPGQTSPYQQFVTPHDPKIQDIANNISNIQDAYELAVRWTWVSDPLLHNKPEKWLLPHQFLVETPEYPTNPLPGNIVSDCSEQANTLVSILRAMGVPPENVRVVLGRVNFSGTTGGHAWVEIKEEGKWMVLDPTCGPYYDEETHSLMMRNGLNFYYWKYHPYPVEEIWAYYNDVYYTDIHAEVAPGWSHDYDVFTDPGTLAMLLSEQSLNLVLIYITSAAMIICIITLLIYSRKKRKQ